MMQWYWCPGLCWVRVFGVGIHAKDVRRHPLIVSERLGMHRRFQIGTWSFRWLRRVPHVSVG